MVLEVTQSMTVEAFDEFALLPENAEYIFEFIAGEVVRIPSRPYASMLAGLIIAQMGIFNKDKNLGYVTGQGGGYKVAGQRFVPDVAFIRKSRQAELDRQGYNRTAPDLAVEVISDPENAEGLRYLRLKLTSYLADNVTTWVVNPDTRLVEIHRPGKAAELVGEDGTLPGDDFLPGLAIAVKDIFPAQEDEAQKN